MERTGMRGLVAVAALLTVGLVAPVAHGADDYPYRGQRSGVDPWGFYKGQCTSFVAFRLARATGGRFHNTMAGPNGRRGRFGNAGNWAANAQNLGWRVDTTPAVGAVAHWGSNEVRGGYGHVAIVSTVYGDGSVQIEEYNFGFNYRYNSRRTRAPRYIHVADAGGTTPPPPPPSRYGPYHTTARPSLNGRSGPGTQYGVVRSYPYGSTIYIVCQVRSNSNVNGSNVWDKLDTGDWVSDYWTSTPRFNDRSDPIPWC